MDTVSLEDFKKVEIRIGKVTSCSKVENADKLLKLQVDFGDFQRQIISAIAQFYNPEDLEGKKLPFIVNLEPRNFRGEESQGMLVAMDTEEKPVLLIPNEDVKEGTLVV
ncbi:MAG: methionine--tRNA ligase subunit beta [Candidatus Levybacteria bacterium RIFCSPHIGHO2_01_FULL_37_17]|nr:MAG: methionine--tRNA ligase subunit beta [Candidatus Levybacteria bacterium RIFCSPHIGHO2_01_FULL_37_17]OGH36886.1 MAG: methionine--tRNA ligase subunit beta [Candidatus Levybacteria bacterium RIFCSPLOWO2_01_FULL_38_23]